MKNENVARWVAATCLFGGLLFQVEPMWMLVKDQKHYQTAAVVASVIIGLGPCMFLPGALERLRFAGKVLAGANSSPSAMRKAVALVTALWASLWTAVGVGWLVWILNDSGAVITHYTRLLSPRGLNLPTE